MIKEYNQQQSGVALVIGLVMLLLLTIIMISAVQVTLLEERMAGNLKNTNIAFQAAESALREAEVFIENQATAAGVNHFHPFKFFGGPFQATDPVCAAGLCGTSSPLQSDDLSSVTGKQTASTGISGIAAEPEYIIEYILFDAIPGHSGIRLVTFRITARAWGEDPSSVVQLQSTYRVIIRSFVG